jgi:sugar lactone lactonase YvrE
MYALASAYALNGDAANALETLRRFAALGYCADAAADSDFAGLRGASGFAEVRRALEANRRPVVKSSVAFTLAERDLLTEGIAYQPETKAFFVGSVHRRKIVRVDRSGRATDFVPTEHDGIWAPLGMKVDAGRGLLWVAAAAVPQMLDFDSADAGRSGLFRYVLATAALTGKFLISPDGVPHLLGDLTIARNGDVYASDSRAPIVWRIRAGTDSLERFIESPLLLSAQGLALTPDEQTLYLADYSRGILKIDLSSRSLTLLPCRDGVLALGIDGLYLAGGTLIGIQNGVDPHRVVRLTLDSNRDSLIESEVLERRHPSYSEPTLGVLVGAELFYIANSQWEKFGETGTVARPDELRPPAILRLRL